MKSKLIHASLCFIVLLFSCNRPGRDNMTATVKTSDLAHEPLQGKFSDQAEDKLPSGNQHTETTDSSNRQPAIKPPPVTDWDKKIIKAATLKLEIKNFRSYNETVHKTVRQFGGYIAQEENNLTDEKSENVITIKVPVEQFEDMMNQLPGSDAKVLERKITTEDVTAQVVDTRSRLEAKKQMRMKYLEFLKQSKNMEEVLQVQGEINNIQEQIESAAGRIEFLSHQSAFSTINLTFFEPVAGYKPDNPETLSFFHKVSDAFRSGASWIGAFFVAVISIWPLILLIIAGVLLIRKNKSKQIITPNS